MSVSITTCLLACASSLTVGLCAVSFATNATQKGLGVGIMVASIGIGIALLIAAEME